MLTPLEYFPSEAGPAGSSGVEAASEAGLSGARGGHREEGAVNPKLCLRPEFSILNPQPRTLKHEPLTLHPKF